MKNKTEEKLTKKDIAFWILVFPVWFGALAIICGFIGMYI